MPHPPAAVAPTPHRPAAAATGGRAVWEYEGNHGNWEAFADDCQGFLEKEYSKFTSGKGKGKGKGKDAGRINVRTSGTTVSVDFGRMTSKVQDSHKIRSIRRTE